MAVNVEFDTFRFSSARYVKPHNKGQTGNLSADLFINEANDLVREIARAGWEVPGVDVTIRYYGSGTNVLKHCSNVSFEVQMPDGSVEKARISYFGKAGPQVGRWNQLGCASGFKLGDLAINLHDDGSGDWRKSADLKKALEAVRAVTDRIRALPAKDGHDVDHVEGDLNLREICTSVPTPAPADFPVLYAWVERDKAHNALGLTRGYNDDDWARDDHYRLMGNGWRFVSLDFCSDDVPSAAWSGYDYASPDISERPAGLAMRSSSGILPVEIKLRHLDDIYVADVHPYENARDVATAEAEAEGRKEWRPGEYEGFVRKSLATFVPASEYKGGYVKPVYMIGRQLQSDEARGMHGRLTVGMDDGGFVVARMHDVDTGRDVTLYEGGDELYHKKSAVQDAWEIARILGTKPTIAPEITEAIDAHTERLREEYKNDSTMGAILG